MRQNAGCVKVHFAVLVYNDVGRIIVNAKILFCQYKPIGNLPVTERLLF